MGWMSNTGSNPVLTTKKCYCGSDLLQPSDSSERRAFGEMAELVRHIQQEFVRLAHKQSCMVV
jgi:hypothetical protein